VPNPLMSLLTSATSGGASPVPGPGDLVKNVLRGQPAYVENRERAAVVLDTGFRVADGYAKAKPFIFVGALVGMGVSGTALVKRRSRGAETVTLWSAVFLVSAISAWITRPALGAQKLPVNATEAQKSNFKLLQMIDQRRATLKSRDPNFADKVFTRFEEIPSVKAGLESSPLLKAAL
jgi:hypothetical protein